MPTMPAPTTPTRTQTTSAPTQRTAPRRRPTCFAVPMPVQLNHTIVAARDRHESAAFFTEILGLPPHTTYGPFAVVELDNEVSLDFIDDPVITQRHYAF